MVIGIYALCHMIVDGICAYAMFGQFQYGKHGYEYILWYNLCAFALQILFGVILDWIHSRYGDEGGHKTINYCKWTAILGMILVGIGAFTSPIVLGIGNALFHIGGGVETIHIDFEKQYKGAALGIFVAPGALGLFLGKMSISWLGNYQLIVILIVALAILVIGISSIRTSKCTEEYNLSQDSDVKDNTRRTRNDMILVVCCFIVVILRSFIGMEGTFPWKTGIEWSVAAVLAVVLGKAAGGILSGMIGMKKAISGSLLAAIVCFAFCENAVMGVLALFFFNMTMPITLYLLVKRFPKVPGFFFGLLTLGLFIGFLPVYYGWGFGIPMIVQNTMILGSVGSAFSLVLLMVACLCL